MNDERKPGKAYTQWESTLGHVLGMKTKRILHTEAYVQHAGLINKNVFAMRSFIYVLFGELKKEVCFKLKHR